MDLQTVVVEERRGRIVAIDSAYHVDERNTGRDVVVSASYSGVLPARFVAERAPRAAIGLDCGIGPEGAGIAGLWFYEALGIPAATADVRTVLLGDGVDVVENGVVSRLNAPAAACGVTIGMPVREAALVLLRTDPVPRAADEGRIARAESAPPPIVEQHIHNWDVQAIDTQSFRDRLERDGTPVIERVANAAVRDRTKRVGRSF